MKVELSNNTDACLAIKIQQIITIVVNPGEASHLQIEATAVLNAIKISGFPGQEIRVARIESQILPHPVKRR